MATRLSEAMDIVRGRIGDTPVSGPAQWRNYLMADGRMVAEQVAVSGGAATMQYFVADHLGSIAVVADGSGNVVQRMIYDPWGVQLAPDNSQLCGVGAPTTRGFTGEEQAPVDCLVNLNARLYDPTLGQFLSGDPVVGSVYDPQGLNRYSYVHDNPLSFTDTDGECGPLCFLAYAIADLIIAEAFKPVFERLPVLGDLLIVVQGVACGPIAGPVCAAEGAGMLAGVESGNVGKGVEAFVLTVAQGEAFKYAGTELGNAKIGAFSAQGFIAHGLVGGTFSVLQGGNFGSGFLSAGVAELASPYITDSTRGDPALGVAESAILGGTTSVIGGGKFDNGAVTGAFGYLFNDLAHSWGAAGAAGGAVAGGVAVSGACDVATDGACALATPATVTAGSVAGAAIGGAAGAAAGTVVDEVVVTAQRVNANSSSSMQGTELYYLINRASGKIDKIGVTSYPGQRYSDAYLKAENVFYQT